MSQLRARDLVGFKLKSKHLSKFEIIAIAIVFIYFASMAYLFFF